MDKSTFILFGILHGQANPDHLSIDDIDKLVTVTNSFLSLHGDTDWEEKDWTDTAAEFYNQQCETILHWNKVGMNESDPMAAVKEKMSNYLSEDESDYDDIIVSLKEALVSNPDSLIDFVEYNKRDGDTYSLQTICVWEKVELEFTVREFCELVGITI
jgi:hypothetical protein